MRYIYYVLMVYHRQITGPLSFKEAVYLQRESDTPAIILKEVVDETGREVK